MGVKSEKILISGAGIAGPALALFLAKAGRKSVLLERSTSFRTSGQQVDIAGLGLEVIRALNLETEIRAKRVEDKGIIFCSSNNSPIASFPASNAPCSAVKEIEILRPDLARVLFDASSEHEAIEYRFGVSIWALEQHSEGVTVTFSSSSEEKEEFAAVIAADGLNSSTRALAFPRENTRLADLGQYCGYYFIPWTESDGDWSRWYNAPQGRTLVLRPNPQTKLTGAYLCQISPDAGHLSSLSAADQRAELIKRFTGTGWESARMLSGLQTQEGRETFYFQHIAQAKSTLLAHGRVALLGDAGYAPSPVSGEGTSLALVGTYVLAGCLTSLPPGREEEALKRYEAEVREYVDASQKLPPGVPWIVNPQTKAGIVVMSALVWLAGWMNWFGVFRVVAWSMGALKLGKKRRLPMYPALGAVTDSGKS